MADFINTIDALGDDAVIDSIINRTITEFKDDSIEAIGSYAFYKCTALGTVDLPNVTSVQTYAFYSCSALASVNLPSLQTLDTYCAIGHCSNLTKVVLPELTELGYYAFSYSKVNILDLPKITTLSDSAIDKATVNHLIIRTGSVCTLNKSMKYCPVNIYVPAALIDSYKAATNWSTHAATFRALEDYTVDGTTTGALDETKI